MPPTTTKSESQSHPKTTPREHALRKTQEARMPPLATKDADNDQGPEEMPKATRKDDALAITFKDDLTNIRSLVTCSICNQLLYEPFTIQCGHTYCYSCLCSWFTPNKSNKTCPECRTAVKQLPAPSFMIKQLVEMFTKRVELMPADESVDQHITKRAEEIAAVEEDRSSERGLFKGLFSAQTLLHDEADGVHRCPTCHTEYTGGPNCLTCGTEIDGDSFDFSGDDFDLDALDEDLDLEEELELEFRQNRPVYRGMPHYPHHHPHFRALRFGGRRGRNHESTPSITSDSDDSGDFDLEGDRRHRRGRVDSDSEDEGSIQDFIVNDDSPERRRVTTPPGGGLHDRVQAETSPYGSSRNSQQSISSEESSDDSDEDVVQRGRRNRRQRLLSPRRSQVVDLTEDDDDTDEDSIINTSERLRDAGWSPLHGNDHEELDPRGSDRDVNDVSDHSNEVSSATDEDDSDTETMIGNDEAPNRRTLPWNSTRLSSSRAIDHWDDHDGNGSEISSNTDHDGDTEMSVSPVSHGLYRGDYGDYPVSESSQASRLATEEYEEHYDRDPYGFDGARDLGESHEIHDLDEDSDDLSSPPIRSRVRAQPNRRSDFDPRISQIFATHQNHRQGSNDSDDHINDLEQLDTALSEPSRDRPVPRYPDVYSRGAAVHLSRSRAAVRQTPPSRFSSVSPRIVLSSARPHRIERRYHVDPRRSRAPGY